MCDLNSNLFSLFSFELWPSLWLSEWPGPAVLMSPFVAASVIPVTTSTVRNWLLCLLPLQWRNAQSQRVASATAGRMFLIFHWTHFLSQLSFHLLFWEADTQRDSRDEEFWMEDNLHNSALYISRYPLTIVLRASGISSCGYTFFFSAPCLEMVLFTNSSGVSVLIANSFTCSFSLYLVPRLLGPFYTLCPCDRVHLPRQKDYKLELRADSSLTYLHSMLLA